MKGICFEYQYEFGEKSIGRVCLCDEYSDETDSWGKERYDLRSVIEGPDVSEFFGFDPHYHWDAFNRHIAEEYVYGRLLAAVLEEWKASGIVGLPFGFASQDHFLVDHDHYMVRAPANEH